MKQKMKRVINNLQKKNKNLLEKLKKFYENYNKISSH